MMEWARTICNSIYPSICEHCGALLDAGTSFLCVGCLLLLKPISMSGRCQTCFCLSLSEKCVSCSRLGGSLILPYHRLCEPSMVFKTLLRLHKAGDARPAAFFAALIVCRLIELEWWPVNIISPIPLRRGWARFVYGRTFESVIASMLQRYGSFVSKSIVEEWYGWKYWINPWMPEFYQKRCSVKTGASGATLFLSTKLPASQMRHQVRARPVSWNPSYLFSLI